MSIVQVTTDNFEQEVLKSEQPVLIDFWAAWCMPCKQFAPTFEEVSAEYEGKVKFVKIDVDESKELAIKYKVLSIPTIAVIKDGEIADRQAGVMQAEGLKAWIDGAI